MIVDGAATQVQLFACKLPYSVAYTGKKTPVVFTATYWQPATCKLLSEHVWEPLP